MTYRDPRTGQTRTRSCQARDRAACVAACRAQGISPIAITIRKGGKASRDDGEHKRLTGVRGLALVVVALLVVAAAVWVWMRLGQGEVERVEGNEGRMQKQPSRPAPTTVRTNTNVVGRRTYAEAKGERSKVGAAAKPPPMSRPALENRSDEATEDGEVQDAPDRPKRLFENGTDQLINLATSTPEGAPMPPLPPMTREDTDHFIMSLKKPVHIDEDDPPRIQEMKKRVQAVREQIAQALSDDPNRELSEILNGHRELFNENSRLYAQSKAEYDELVEAGNLEEARKYREAVNAELAALGAKQIENEDETGETGEEKDEEQDKQR